MLTAVARAWFDWILPRVTTQSFFFSFASARINSSLRTCGGDLRQRFSVRSARCSAQRQLGAGAARHGAERQGTLLPESCMPVRSSRLIHISTPSGRPGRCQRWMGVGRRARDKRCVGGLRRDAQGGGVYGEISQKAGSI